MKKLKLSEIRVDGGTQSRAGVDQVTVDEYAAAMTDGADFPALVVFYDGSTYWLADGFHRFTAAKQAKLKNFACDVRQGTQRDAVLFSVGANATHGLRRTNADKRRAVEKLLTDAEWSLWSDREIARRCGVSNRFVSNLRDELPSVNGSQIAERKVERGGTTYTQNTANIGTTVQPLFPHHNKQADTSVIWLMGSTWAARGRVFSSYDRIGKTGYFITLRKREIVFLPKFPTMREANESEFYKSVCLEFPGDVRVISRDVLASGGGGGWYVLLEKPGNQASYTPSTTTAPSGGVPTAGELNTLVEPQQQVGLALRVKISSGRNDEGAAHRMIVLASDLIKAGKWDGNGEIWFDDPYQMHGLVNVGGRSLEDLIIERSGAHTGVRLDGKKCDKCGQEHEDWLWRNAQWNCLKCHAQEINAGGDDYVIAELASERKHRYQPEMKARCSKCAELYKRESSVHVGWELRSAGIWGCPKCGKRVSDQLMDIVADEPVTAPVIEVVEAAQSPVTVREVKKYSVLLMDPPWEYEKNRSTFHSNANHHYETMSVSEMAGLPVATLTADNCALIMWGTWPKVFQMEKLALAWGFEYRTAMFTWVKVNKSADVQRLNALDDKDWFMGQGSWTRANTEFAMLFTLGDPVRLNADVRQLIVAPTGRHSEKPDEQYERIERMFAGPYLELFARSKRAGWDAWGNEVQSDISFAGIEAAAR